MRIGAARIVAIMMAMAVSPASATKRISDDPGGQLGPYLQRLAALRSSGEQVVIDGRCLSACTMVLGAIPRDHICVTSRAQLGFHAAWRPEAGRQVTSREGTQLLMDNYPEQVREWIAQRGGLSPKMIYLAGRDLESMYPTCQEHTARVRQPTPQRLHDGQVEQAGQLGAFAARARH
jgi:hypothetical protein